MKRARWFLGGFLLTWAVLHRLNAATSYYASPSGSGTDCSLSIPCSLATGLTKPMPGDTLWLLGGTYRGHFTVSISGATIRPVAGARVTIDANLGPGNNGRGDSTAFNVLVTAKNNTFRDVEVTNTDAIRSASQPGSHPPDTRDHSFMVYGDGTKLINLVIHDTGEGPGLWEPATTAEMYGNVVYYNGWDASDRGHGHNAYVQSKKPGSKKILENVMGFAFDVGGQWYGSSAAYADNVSTIGNVIFGSGDIGNGSTGAKNLIHGAGGSNDNPVVDANMTYCKGPRSNDQGSYNAEIGYGGTPCINAKITNNYLVGGQASFALGDNCAVSQMSGNTFLCRVLGFTSAQWPSNTYLDFNQTPTVNKIFVRANAYEAGRANITIYNWQKLTSVTVPASMLTGILASGDQYEVRFAMNFYGAPVASGTYSGAGIAVPMTGYAEVAPVGLSAPTTLLPEFGAYVLRLTGGAPSTPTSTPAGATATKTATSSLPTLTATGLPTSTRTATMTWTPNASASPTLTPTPTVTSPPSQAIYLEAESGARIAPMTTAADPLASGGSYVSSATPDAGTVSFSIQGTGAMTYVWHRVLCPSPTADSLYLTVDGADEVIDDTCEGMQGPAWQWTRVTERNAGTPGARWQRVLASGTRTLTFRGREVGLKVDRIAITTDANFIPSDVGSSTPTPTRTWTPSPSPTKTKTPTKTRTPTRTPTPQTVCVTVTP